MEGWCSVEELVQWGFAHAAVVMANEAHSGLQRCVRTREVGVRMVRAAHEAGVRRLAMEFTNWREHEQAANLCRLTAGDPAEPLLVWCGNGHASKIQTSDWTPMGWHYRAMSGAEQFVIDQTVTVAWEEQPQPWVPELLAGLGDTLAAHGGSAGILREQAPAPLDCRDYADAFVVSTENALT